jgi:hypothetical protein
MKCFILATLRHRLVRSKAANPPRNIGVIQNAI